MFYTGAVPQPEKKSDFLFKDVAGSATIDFIKGYDIREKLGADFPKLDQQQSLSCVAHAWAYYIWVKEILEQMSIYKVSKWTDLPKEVTQEISTRAIYSQIFLPNGGAFIYDGGRIVTNWGSVKEFVVPSSINGKKEEWFMRDKTWKKEWIDDIAKVLVGKNVRTVDKGDMVETARAIYECDGAVGGMFGDNEGQWSSERPQPPKKKVWAHCIFFGAYGSDEYGDFVASPNSWGDYSWMKEWKPGSKPGTGWQKFYINYVNKEFQFNQFTYTDMPNNPEQIRKDFIKKMTGKLFKNINDPKVYYSNGKQIAWIENEAKFKFGKEAGWFGGFDTVVDLETQIKEDITF